MGYEEVEKTILKHLTNDDEKCLSVIENNKKIISESFMNPDIVKNFVKLINNVIVENIKKYSLVEKVLKHELFTNVLTEFRKSNILIKAIDEMNEKTIDWVMTMNVDTMIQDKRGRTALMHATALSLVRVVKKLIAIEKDSLYVKDNEGNSVLYYASSDWSLLEHLWLLGLNPNDVNNLHENLLLTCCRNKKFECIDEIIDITDYFTLINNEGKSAAIYLIENGNYKSLNSVLEKISSKKFIEQNSKRFVTCVIDQFKEIYKSGCTLTLEKTVKTLMILCCNKYDFNVTIDEEGNTPIMYFLMVGDLFTATFLLEYVKDIDLSIRNVNGISATTLSTRVNNTEALFNEMILTHKTFDFNFVDPLQNNLLTYYIYFNNESYALKHILKSEKSLTYINNKHENIAIVATKLRKLKEVFISPENINQQDIFGNTALYYAVNLQDREAVNLLLYKKADPHIKNNQGVSPLDLANQIKNEKILKTLRNPIKPEEMTKKVKNSKKTFLFFDKNDDSNGRNQISYEREFEYIGNSITYPERNQKVKIDFMLIDCYYDCYNSMAPKRMEKERRTGKDIHRYIDYELINLLAIRKNRNKEEEEK